MPFSGTDGDPMSSLKASVWVAWGDSVAMGGNARQHHNQMELYLMN